MYQSLKSVAPKQLLFITFLLLQSCTAPQQAAKPASPVPDTNEITVFYDSDPPGAALYEIGKINKLGETPFWATYRLSEKELQEGAAFLDPTRVVWPSGATTSNHPGIVYYLKKGREQSYVFRRPDVPGAEADYDSGLKRMMRRIEKGEDEGSNAGGLSR